MALRSASLTKKRCPYSVPHWGSDSERWDRAVHAVCGQLSCAKFSRLLEPDQGGRDRDRLDRNSCGAPADPLLQLRGPGHQRQETCPDGDRRWSGWVFPCPGTPDSTED